MTAAIRFLCRVKYLAWSLFSRDSVLRSCRRSGRYTWRESVRIAWRASANMIDRGKGRATLRYLFLGKDQT